MVGLAPTVFSKLSIENPRPQVCAVPKIKIYSAINNQFICEGVSCQYVPDKISQALAKTFADIHQFFSRTFGLCGIFKDEIELPPIYKDLNDDNAYWSPGRLHWQINNKYVPMEEVLVHEYTHAINHSRLSRKGQSEALNESLSDVFGLIYKHFKSRNYSDWSIVDRDASQFAHMSHFPGSPLAQESHDYSKVVTHVFYRAIQTCQVQISCAENLMGRVWFNAMKKLEFNESFESFASKTLASSDQMRDSVVKQKLCLTSHLSVDQQKLLMVTKSIRKLVQEKQFFSKNREQLLLSMRERQRQMNNHCAVIQQARNEIAQSDILPSDAANAKQRIRYHCAQLTEKNKVQNYSKISLAQLDTKIQRHSERIFAESTVQDSKRQRIVCQVSHLRRLDQHINILSRIASALKKAWSDVGVI